MYILVVNEEKLNNSYTLHSQVVMCLFANDEYGYTIKLHIPKLSCQACSLLLPLKLPASKAGNSAPFDPTDTLKKKCVQI